MSAPITEKVSDERLAQAQAYAAKVSKGVPLDQLWEVFALGLKELQQLRITATASDERAAKYEAAFKDSNASFQIAFKGCGERNTLLRDLRSYVLVHGSDKDMAPLIERIDQMVKV